MNPKDMLDFWFSAVGLMWWILWGLGFGKNLVEDADGPSFRRCPHMGIPFNRLGTHPPQQGLERLIGCTPRCRARRCAVSEIMPSAFDFGHFLRAATCSCRHESLRGQVLRLSGVYALLDRSRIIRVQHLHAALAFWDYAERSAELIFGNASGDPVEDRILKALTGRFGGMTRTEISKCFSANQ
jgi:hypothetical protein